MYLMCLLVLCEALGIVPPNKTDELIARLRESLYQGGITPETLDVRQDGAFAVC